MKLFFSLALVFLAFPSADARQGCDLAKTERAFYCESCSEVKFKDGLVSNKVYYRCEGCGVNEDKSGKCPDCDADLVKTTSGAGVCGACYEKPVACEVCVKESFECSGCGASSNKAGTCAECKVAFEKTVSKALIKYECAECATESFTAGKCTDDDCPNKGKPLTKTCTESGHAPHVSGA